jgi:preprotein translocase SecE subunit
LLERENKVADAKKSKIRKPRVRKAPTLREQAELARSKAETEKEPGKIRKFLSRIGAALKKTRLTRNPITKFIARIGRFILKILRWLTPNYFINAWREVRLVTWPTRKETWRLTLAVFIFAAVFGAMVSGVDKVLDIIFKKIILK